MQRYYRDLLKVYSLNAFTGGKRLSGKTALAIIQLAGRIRYSFSELISDRSIDSTVKGRPRVRCREVDI